MTQLQHPKSRIAQIEQWSKKHQKGHSIDRRNFFDQDQEE